MSSYKLSLIAEMLRNMPNFYTNNWDPDRGIEPEFTFRSIFHPILSPLFLNADVQKISYLYNLLEDKESKQLLIKILAYRYMGHRKVKLPRNTPERDDLLLRMQNLKKIGEPLQIEFMNAKLPCHDLEGIGLNYKSYCSARGGSYIFLQRQYDLNRYNVVCKAEKGDIVFDAGACWGETTLYFADAVGETGKVIAFEFIPSNAHVLEENIRINPDLAKRIKVIDKPLWNVSDQELYYVDWGPGSRVSFNKLRDDFPDDKCFTTTIDDVVKDQKLESVDFIKMDIEGAEPSALEGAIDTIKKFHPKMAISIYHNIDDFTSIPKVIESTGMKYKYYLEHHTIFENETVLFAVPQ